MKPELNLLVCCRLDIISEHIFNSYIFKLEIDLFIEKMGEISTSLIGTSLTLVGFEQERNLFFSMLVPSSVHENIEFALISV